MPKVMTTAAKPTMLLSINVLLAQGFDRADTVEYGTRPGKVPSLRVLCGNLLCALSVVRPVRRGQNRNLYRRNTEDSRRGERGTRPALQIALRKTPDGNPQRHRQIDSRIEDHARAGNR